MTRKDYSLVSSALNAELHAPNVTGLEMRGIVRAAWRLAVDIKAVNPSFDQDRFMSDVHGSGNVTSANAVCYIYGVKQ